MVKERKKHTAKEVAVAVVEWQPSIDVNVLTLDSCHQGKSMVLVVKRPEKGKSVRVPSCSVRRTNYSSSLLASGLLAGLWEFPSIELDVPNKLTTTSLLPLLAEYLGGILLEPLPLLASSSGGRQKKKNRRSSGSTKIDGVDVDLDSVHHVFSHLKVEYKPIFISISCPTPPLLIHSSAASDHEQTGNTPTQAKWIPSSQIEKFNFGNATKKIWHNIAQRLQIGERTDEGSAGTKRKTGPPGLRSATLSRKKPRTRDCPT